MYDETRAYLSELVASCKNNSSSYLIWNEIVGVYDEFRFSPLVFDMLLKIFAENGLIKDALNVFDNMGKYGRVPSLKSCNSLLSNLV